MRKRFVDVAVAGMSAAFLGSAGCDLVQGLQPASVVETGGGGQGGPGGTTTTGGTGGTTTTGGSGGQACEPGTSIPCYDGPAGTQGVAMCTGGNRSCKMDGSGYEEACVGQVLPAAETCADTSDEDCDALDCVRWAAVFGDAAIQRPLDIKTDGAGNVYVLGSFQGALDAVSPALVSAGQDDLFLLKMDPAGAVVWARQFGDSAAQSSGRLAVATDGSIALRAAFDGLVDFGTGNLGPGGTAVVKLDTNGNTLWANRFAPKLIGDIAIEKAGKVLFFTSFEGNVNFGTGLFDAGAYTNLALVQFSADAGQTVWAKQLGYLDEYDFSDGLAVDSSNNIVLAGSFTDKINLGGGDLLQVSSGYTELFVARFDQNGGYAAANNYAELAEAGEMAIDSLGSTLLTSGYEYAPLVYNSVLKKVDNMVVEVWSKPFNSVDTYTTLLNAIAVSPDDHVITAFTVNGPNDLGGGVLPPIGTMDILLAKLTPDGDHVWSRRFGAMGAEQVAPVVTVAPNGDIVMAAQVSGTINVGTGPLETKGNDLLVARFAP